jgi:hypothetical protein
MQTVNGDDDSISLQSNQGFCQDNTGKTREKQGIWTVFWLPSERYCDIKPHWPTPEGLVEAQRFDALSQVGFAISRIARHLTTV